MKKLQLDTIKLDVEFHHDAFALDQQYQEKHNEIFKKRMDIVNGNYQPSEEECSDDCFRTEMNIHEISEVMESPAGIPHFWLNVFKNVSELRSMLTKEDEEVLKHLVNICSTTKSSPELSFSLEFEFEPNQFFQNSVLTKTYLMKISPDTMDPFCFEGPEIYKSIGCEIMWNEGKCIPELSTKASTMPFFKSESFFNFFNPPELKAPFVEGNGKIEVNFDLLNFKFEFSNRFSFRLIWKTILKSATTSRSVSSLELFCSSPARWQTTCLCPM